MYTSKNKKTGGIGEQYAARYLREHGYVILGINVYSRWGEIDIVSEKAGIVVFVEVKSRKSVKKGNPYEAVSQGKIRRLMRTVDFYIKQHQLYRKRFRLDVIAIKLDASNKLEDLKHYENVGTT